jgi:hypothetical protein
MAGDVKAQAHNERPLELAEAISAQFFEFTHRRLVEFAEFSSYFLPFTSAALEHLEEKQ